jgi:hypothetical protein
LDYFPVKEEEENMGNATNCFGSLFNFSFEGTYTRKQRLRSECSWPPQVTGKTFFFGGGVTGAVGLYVV